MNPTGIAFGRSAPRTAPGIAPPSPGTTSPSAPRTTAPRRKPQAIAGNADEDLSALRPPRVDEHAEPKPGPRGGLGQKHRSVCCDCGGPPWVHLHDEKYTDKTSAVPGVSKSRKRFPYSGLPGKPHSCAHADTGCTARPGSDRKPIGESPSQPGSNGTAHASSTVPECPNESQLLGSVAARSMSTCGESRPPPDRNGRSQP